MTPATSKLLTPLTLTAIQERIEPEIDSFLASLPKPEHLTAAERRGILARYTAVLEGNFIYWMTGTFLAVKSEEARAEITTNLTDEVRDAHPLMLRKFAMAANAIPTDSDVLAVHKNLTNVRLFVGRLSTVPLVTMLAFFEDLLQRFMPYLAELAKRQGSSEMEYTDVHSVVDIVHTAGLYRSLQAELELAEERLPAVEDPFEGVELLRTLLQNVITA